MKSVGLPVMLSAFLACGCGTAGPGAVAVASYDPDAIAAAAMKELDKNSSGELEANELESAQGIKLNLMHFDSNKDRKVSREELKQRFQQYAAGGPAAIVVPSIEVKLNGQPLEGAKVTFTPEPYMGKGFKPASAMTDKDGIANIQIEGESRVGVPAGLYRISVTKADASGKEILPPRYNSQTTLGREVLDDGRSGGALIELNLSTKQK